jgi:cytochrome P450
VAQALLVSSDEGAYGSVRTAAHLMSLLGDQDSSATVISHGIGAMLSCGDQWRGLAEEPELAGDAVEAAIRFVSPSQTMMRRATVTARFAVERQNANRHLRPAPLALNTKR